MIFPCKAQETGLPVPRFVSLRFNQVNLRTGPGIRYPVEWMYVKRDMPVEIVSEFEHWRKIKDLDGNEGWVHQHMLSGRRNATAKKDGVLLRAPSRESLPLARFEAGVTGKILSCPEKSPLCRIDFAGYQGWTDRKNLWGVYPDEIIE